jgi:transcriptional regulator with XRE-family HTH domain
MHAFLARPSRYLPILIPAFGAWIRNRRLQLGINRARAAAETGIDRIKWSDLEQGWVPITDDRLLRSIASTLQIQYEVMVNVIAPLEAHFADAED